MKIYNAIKIVTEHLTWKTIDKYFKFDHTIERRNIDVIEFPKHKMPWDVCVYASDYAGCIDGDITSVMIEIHDVEKPIEKYDTYDGNLKTDTVNPIPDDLLNLLNWCIAHDIKFISFVNTTDYDIDEDNINDYIIPELRLYRKIVTH